MADGASGTPIDSISIEIGASSTKAINNINKLADTLRGLRHALHYETGDTAKKLTKLANALNRLKDASEIKLNNRLPKQIRELGETIGAVSDDTIRKLDEMTAAIERLRGIDLRGFSSAVKAAQKASGQVTALQTMQTQTVGGYGGPPGGGGKTRQDPIKMLPQRGLVPTQNTSDKDISDMFNRDFGGNGMQLFGGRLLQDFYNLEIILSDSIGPAIQLAGNALGKMVGSAVKLGKAFAKISLKGLKGLWDHSAFKSLETAANRVQKVLSSFGRIAFYRAVRSAIRYVTDALKEGTENAYWYAREFGNATKYIADAYDQMSSANFRMSNQLGAAWATLIATIQPIIQKIIALVTRAADVLTQFFALLGGKTSYLKAVDYNKKWADSATGAAKAAEEWKNQLMGFDEINRLEEPSDGGGGGGGGLADYENMFEETPLESPFFDQVREMIKSGEWEELGKMLGEKVNSLVDSIDFKKIGKYIGEKLNNAIRLSYSFLKTVDFQNIGAKVAELLNNAMEQIDFGKLGRLRIRIKTALWDAIYGAVTTIEWDQVAVSLSYYLIGEMNELAEWISGLDSGKIAKAFDDFFGNVKWDEISEAAVKLLQTAFQKMTDVLTEADVSGALRNIGGLIKEVVKKGIFNEDFSVLFAVLQYKIEAAIFGEKWTNWDWKTFGKGKGADVVIGMIDGAESEAPGYENALQKYINDPTEDSLNRLKETVDNNGAEMYGSMEQALADIGVSMNGFSTTVNNTSADVSNSFGTVSGAAWSMARDGSNAMSSMASSVYGNGQNMVDNLGAIRQAAADTWAWLQRIGNQGQARIDANGGIWTSLGGFASGGFPEDGLFMANHGELVGKFSNGKTAVANNEQIVEGISAGVYDAVTAALSNGGGSSQPVNIYLDGKLIAKSTTKYQNQYARVAGI